MNIVKTFAYSCLIGLGFGILSCSQDEQPKSNTSIHIEMNDYDTVVLSEIHPQQAIAIDTQIFVNGVADFHFDIENPSFYSLIYNNKTATTLFIEKGDRISVKLDTNKNGITYDIEGSENSKKIEELFKLQGSYTRTQKRLIQNTQGATPERLDSIKTMLRSMDTEFKKSMIKYIEKNTSSPASLLALFQGTGQQMIFDLYLDYPIFSKVHDSLQSNYPKFESHLKFFKENLDRTLAKDFQLPDTEGNIVHFSDYKGKWVMLDFWASWCKPCRVQNPALVELHKKYKDLQMISVTLDGMPNQQDAKADWKNAIKKDKLTDNWLHLGDLKGGQTPVAQLYEFKSIPQTLLINPEGRIVAKNLYVEQLDALLTKIYKK